MKFPRLLLLLCLSFTLASCPIEDDGIEYVDDRPWERQFLHGNTIINGQDVITNEESTLNESATDYVCFDALPTDDFQTFSINIFVPTHSDSRYQSGMVEREWVIFFDATVTTDIYLSGTLQFIEKLEINGVMYSKFLVGGRYDGTDPITRENFQQMRIEFDIAYQDENEEELYSDLRVVTINIDPC
jgi:hypothetical protein